ncbi:iron hydrogenase [bacterium]|nr:iron hydrogenase [bacterium]
MVKNNIYKKGEVVFSEFIQGEGLKKAIAMNNDQVIEQVKASNIRGRGGAGFPTGLKWDFTRKAQDSQKFVICNADEGEPGTFKDRVILTERPGLVFEGMTVAGYAIGADTGIIYLRGEYAYLRAFLEKTLSDMRSNNQLGKNILGKAGFDFDIRIQMGAGAYVCGEETALISSCEGLRGDPKNRPPFPAQKGYLGHPTTVNNVETFCGVSRIMDKGAEWFNGIGTEKSSGTKLLSVSGDCAKPGVYEVAFGMTVNELLQEVGATDTMAVQMSGASGEMLDDSKFEQKICFSELATGGSVMIFNNSRNPLEIAHAFMEFFVEESCGYCTPCRVGNVLLKKGLEKIIAGKGEPEDLEYLEKLSNSVIASSRCGMGQTSPKPILSTLKNFRPHYEKIVVKDEDGFQRDFDIKAALGIANKLQGRESVIYK